MYQAANRSNVAIYPVDPRGMTGESIARTTAAQMMNFTRRRSRHAARARRETGGRAIVYRNDIRGEIGADRARLARVLPDRLRTPHPEDGKFHRVTRARDASARDGVRADRLLVPEARAEQPTAPPSLAPAICRGGAGGGEPPRRFAPARTRRSRSKRRRVRMPVAESTPSAAGRPPRCSLRRPSRSRAAASSATRLRAREFRRTDTIVVRAATTAMRRCRRACSISIGQPLTDIAVTRAAGGCQLMLPLGNLGAGDYVVELSRVERPIPPSSSSRFACSRELILGMASRMRTLLSAAVVLIVALGASGHADQGAQQQQPQQSQQPQPKPAAGDQQQPPPVFRAGINFVRVDVIITDKSGEPIADLQPDRLRRHRGRQAAEDRNLQVHQARRRHRGRR